FLIDSASYVIATALAMVVWNSRKIRDPDEFCAGFKLHIAIENTTQKTEPIFTEAMKEVWGFREEKPLVLVACFCKMAAAIGWGITNVIVIRFSQNNVSFP